jgi:hypothetical protein
MAPNGTGLRLRRRLVKYSTEDGRVILSISAKQ